MKNKNLCVAMMAVSLTAGCAEPDETWEELEREISQEGDVGDLGHPALAAPDEPAPGIGQPEIAASYFVRGVEQVVTFSRASQSEPIKHALAVCPEGKVIVGGGGGVWESSGQPQHRLALQELWPTSFLDSDGDLFYAYRVTGVEVSPGLTENWQVLALAICADPPPGYLVSWGPPTDSTPAGSKTTTVACPSGTTALGAGASVDDFLSDPGVAQVALQTSVINEAGTGAQAVARDDADGYLGQWALRAAVICASNSPVGYEILTAQSPQSASEQVKAAEVLCPSGKQLLGSSGTTSNVVPGNVSLEIVGINQPAMVIAAENTPTNLGWGRVTVRAVCSTRE